MDSGSTATIPKFILLDDTHPVRAIESARITDRRMERNAIVILIGANWTAFFRDAACPLDEGLRAAAHGGLFWSGSVCNPAVPRNAGTLLPRADLQAEKATGSSRPGRNGIDIRRVDVSKLAWSSSFMGLRGNWEIDIVASYTIPVDFNNTDNDGSVRLITNGTMQFIIDRGVQLVDGSVVRLSDGQVTAAGVLERRDGSWVATALKWEPY